MLDLNRLLNSSLLLQLLVFKRVIKPNPLVVHFGVFSEELQLPAVKHAALDFPIFFGRGVWGEGRRSDLS